MLFRRNGRVMEIRERQTIEPIEFAPVGDLPVSKNAARLERLAYVASPSEGGS